ncbi:hypothetical protein ACFLV0_05495 [Chloroflexota bacterium]
MPYFGELQESVVQEVFPILWSYPTLKAFAYLIISKPFALQKVIAVAVTVAITVTVTVGLPLPSAFR